MPIEEMPRGMPREMTRGEMSSGGLGTSGVDTWDVDKWNAHLQRAFPETRFPILEMMIQSFFLPLFRENKVSLIFGGGVRESTPEIPSSSALFQVTK